MLDLTQYKLISFDLDDTLWDCWPVIFRAESRLLDWLTKHYPKITQGEDIYTMRDFRKQMVKDNPDYQFDLTRLRLDSLRLLAKKHDYPLSLAEEAFEVFIQARNEVALYPDAEELLESLHWQARPMASITNGNADVRRIGIAHYFQVSVRAEDVDKGKPFTDMFEYLLQQSGINKKQIIHIGDDPKTDGLAAQNMGIDFIWINRKQQNWPDSMPEPRLEINSFKPLLPD